GCGESTANMNLPDHAEFIIAADHGDAGQKTAKTLAQRHASPDCSVRIATPAKPEGAEKGYDWNDALLDGTDPVLMRDAILNAPIFEQQQDDGHDDVQTAVRQAKQVDTLINLATD